MATQSEPSAEERGTEGNGLSLHAEDKHTRAADSSLHAQHEHKAAMLQTELQQTRQRLKDAQDDLARLRQYVGFDPDALMREKEVLQHQHRLLSQRTHALQQILDMQTHVLAHPEEATCSTSAPNIDDVARSMNRPACALLSAWRQKVFELLTQLSEQREELAHVSTSYQHQLQRAVSDAAAARQDSVLQSSMNTNLAANCELLEQQLEHVQQAHTAKARALAERTAAAAKLAQSLEQVKAHVERTHSTGLQHVAAVSQAAQKLDMFLRRLEFASKRIDTIRFARKQLPPPESGQMSAEDHHDVRHDNDDVTEEVKMLRHELEQVEKDKELLLSKIQQLEVSFDARLEARCKQERVAQAELQQATRDLQARIAQSEASAAAELKRASRLEDALEQSRQEAQHTKAAHEQALAQLRSSHAAELSELQAEHLEYRQEARIQLQKLEQEKAELNMEARRFERMLASIEERQQQQFATERHKLQATIDDLSSELESVTKDRNALLTNLRDAYQPTSRFAAQHVPAHVPAAGRRPAPRERSRTQLPDTTPNVVTRHPIYQSDSTTRDPRDAVGSDVEGADEREGLLHDITRLAAMLKDGDGDGGEA